MYLPFGARQLSAELGYTTNQNSYTAYEYSRTQTGPWTPVCGNGTAGASAWRHCTIDNLAPDTDYWVRVTFVDPDGVNGIPSPQVVGRVRTEMTARTAVVVQSATVTVQETYLLVAVPISEDANMEQ